MFRACLMARVRRRWCVVHTPVRRRGTILPRSATKPCSRRTSRYGIASIFSVQNLQTFLRRKNFPRPPGPPWGRAPGPPWGRPPPERGGGPELGPDSDACDAPESDALPGFSSDIMFPLYSLRFARSHKSSGRTIDSLRTVLGAPGLDFETGDSTKLNRQT